VSSALADISAPSVCYAVATHRGRVKRAYCQLGGAITGVDSTWNVKVRTGAALRTGTAAVSGSANGVVSSVILGYMGTDNFVNEGDLITFTTLGESTTTAPARFTAVIERSN
jgi:hypothetical protein